MGLVDCIAPVDKLLSTARRRALDILGGRKQWAVSIYKTDKLDSLADARVLLNLARSQAREQNPNLIHPLVCIDVIEEGIVSDPRSALSKVFTDILFPFPCTAQMSCFTTLRGMLLSGIRGFAETSTV